MGTPLRLSPDDPDAQWVARIRQGDVQAYEAMFKAYAGMLYAQASRVLPSAAEAEDLVHDVFLAVWRKRATWDPRPSGRAYLVRAVQNRGLNALRHERVVQRWAREVRADDRAMAPAPDAAMLDAELTASMAAALAQLPARAREVVDLRYRQQLPFGEIARRLAISPRTAENHVARAIRRLRALLAGRRD
jgi:RNA polymerase sigma-70 factor (ECF subfamily)